MNSRRLPVLVLSLALAASAVAQYPGWQHAGSLWLLTTPEGANLPEEALERDFPLLVRLDRDGFDFSQAQPRGEDLRFSAAGQPLAYEIEEWNPSDGHASVWVRIPEIRGNTRQELRMHWGKPDAASESDPKAVFNASNGYLGVWHMQDPVRDATGTVELEDTGTTPAPGIIGLARHFVGGTGIHSREPISGYPVGSQPHSTEAWFRADAPNATLVGWGKEAAQGKVVVQFASPPHLRTDCYFSNGSVNGKSRLATHRWVHVLYSYQSGDARAYVNGEIDATNPSTRSPLAITRPAQLHLGGWYGHHDFTGDLDEVRISSVARSAHWARLQHENQKPLPTLPGLLVRPGNTFAVTPGRLDLREGRNATLSAVADGAQKLYWVLQRGDTTNILAVDRRRFTLEAGRVTGRQQAVLQVRAVYPDGTRIREIPVRIREDIPEPAFTLRAPARWDGRQTIEVVADVANLAAMRAKGAGELDYRWTTSGGAVIQETQPDRLILKRSLFSGRLTIQLTLANGGTPTTRTASMMVAEPDQDPWVERTPDPDEKPVDHKFYARDERNEGTLFCNGTLAQPADRLLLRVYANDTLVQTLEQKPAADHTYAFTARLKPGLITYRVELASRSGDSETILHRADDLVCGDAFLIDGQSNALATDTPDEAPRETNVWIRSYGHPGDARGKGSPNLWCHPVWKFEKGDAHDRSREQHRAELGWWGMELAKSLVQRHQIPVCILNAAVGGTRIDQHQRNPRNPADLDTLYGRMLWRVRQARLTHGLRAVIWHQGENDQGAAGPDGGYGWESYLRYFTELSAAWKEDFPNLRHHYVFQIWPDACSMGGGHGNMLREVQRTLPRSYSHLDILATLDIQPPGGCHYPLAGWSEFARRIQPLIERDFHGIRPDQPLTPPNLRQATYTTDRRDEIALEFDQPVVWHPGLECEFSLDGEKGGIESGRVEGNILTLRRKEGRAASTISYLDERSWNPNNLLRGQTGRAALTFCQVPILPAQPAR